MRDYLKSKKALYTALALIAILVPLSLSQTPAGRRFTRSMHIPSGEGSIDVRTLPQPLPRTDVVRQVLRLIDTQHVQPERINALTMLQAGIGAIKKDFKLDLEVGYYSRDLGIPYVSFGGTQYYSTDNVYSGLMYLDAITRPVLSIIATERQIEVEQLVYSFLNGLLRELDPHSNFLNNEEYRDLKRGTQGQFGGVGIVLEDLQSVPVIRDVVPGSAAAHSGFERGDIIVRVGNQFVSFLDIGKVSKEIRKQTQNNRPSPVWVYRPSTKKIHQFKIFRGVIDTKAVEAFDVPNRSDILHIKLSSFSNNVAAELQTILESHLHKPGNKYRYLILDMRGNPGGLLDEAIQVSNLFVNTGKLLTTKSRFESQTEFTTQNSSKFQIPIVVLVNASSASASEIVTGALKDHNRALVVGERSYGKGSVQSLFELDSGTALKLTMAHYFTPSGHSLQGRGVFPHIRIKLIQPKDNAIWMNGNSEQEREEDLAFHLENPEFMEAMDKQVDEFGDGTTSSVWTDAGQPLTTMNELTELDFTYPLIDSETAVYPTSSDSFMRVAIQTADWMFAEHGQLILETPVLQSMIQKIQATESRLIKDKLLAARTIQKDYQQFTSFFDTDSQFITVTPQANANVAKFTQTLAGAIKPFKENFKNIFSQFSLAANRLTDCCAASRYTFEVEGGISDLIQTGGLVGIRIEYGRESPVVWTTARFDQKNKTIWTGHFNLPPLFRGYLSTTPLGDAEHAGFYFKPNLATTGMYLGRLSMNPPTSRIDSNVALEEPFVSVNSTGDDFHHVSVHIPVDKLNPAGTYTLQLVPLAPQSVELAKKEIQLSLLSTKNLAAQFDVKFTEASELSSSTTGIIGAILRDKEGMVYAKWPLIFFQNGKLYTRAQLATIPPPD